MIRNGFVSNSSSSSFCILGVTTDEIEKQVKFAELEDDEEIDWYEKCPKDLSYEGWIEDYRGGGAIGIDPSSMEEDLTVVQNKELVAQKINANFGTNFTKRNIGFIVDGGYNG